MSTAEPGFNRRGIALLLGLASGFSLIFTLLLAFGNDLRSGEDGGAHALSPSATGYAGIVDLAAAAGLSGRVGRSEEAAAAAGLLVLTPGEATAATDVETLVDAQDGAPVLVVLPKWRTAPLPLRPGWVQRVGVVSNGRSVVMLRTLLPGLGLAAATLPAGTPLHDAGRRVAVVAPAGTRTLAPIAGFDPLLADDQGRMVIGWNARHNLYVLADPDLLNNRGMARLAAARAAVRLLAIMGGTAPGGVVFDVSLNGFGTERSLLRSAFAPPLLAVTLSFLIAAGLAGWLGGQRFATPAPPERAIAFGKLALVNNVASLIRMARRDIVAGYAALVGERVALRLHAPPGLAPAALKDWLEARAPGYAALADRAAAARGGDEALAAAQALHQWQEKHIR